MQRKKKKWNLKKGKLALPALPKGGSVTVSVFHRRFSFYPGKLAILVIAALLILVLLVQLLSIPAHRTRALDLNLAAGGNYTLLSGGRDIVMYNKQNIKAVSQKGAVLWSVENAMSRPQVEVADSYVLAADLGGNHAAVLYRKGQKVRDIPNNKDIISAKVNKKGMTALATAADGYKGQVVVYDKKGREQFRLSSGEGYITDIALSENGHYLAVAQMLSAGEVADSKIQFVDLYQKKVVRTVDRPDCVIGELRYSGGKLIAVSDADFCGFSGSGRLLYSVSFAGKKPGKYDISGGCYLVFVTGDNRGNTVLEIYTMSGKCKGRYLSDSHISEVAVHKDMIVAASQRQAFRISPGGKKKKSVLCDHDMKGIGVFGGSGAMLAVGASEAEMMWLR